MPQRKEEFLNGSVYHIILRGIDAKLIFKDKDDYYRGIFSIYEFNNVQPVNIRERRRIRDSFKKLSNGEPDRRRASVESVVSGNNIKEFIDKRDKLVDVLTFCFMPNHIHLLLKQRIDNGVQKFMVKLGSGYGRYFNQKYQRKGYVFQNRFKDVNIKDENQLVIVVNYIHSNPISLLEPKFKEQGIKNHSVEEVINFLKKDYRWSGFPDYAGINNFPSVTERELVLGLMSGSNGVEENIKSWISHKKDLADDNDIILE